MRRGSRWVVKTLSSSQPFSSSVLRCGWAFGPLPFLHENITYPNKKKSNILPITVSRFRFLRINVRKSPDTYCMCVSCVTLPGWDPCPCRFFFIVTRFEIFRINWVMCSWQMVISAILARYPMKTRQMGCDTPLCDTISKGYCAIWGGGYLALGR